MPRGRAEGTGRLGSAPRALTRTFRTRPVKLELRPRARMLRVGLSCARRIGGPASARDHGKTRTREAVKLELPRLTRMVRGRREAARQAGRRASEEDLQTLQLALSRFKARQVPPPPPPPPVTALLRAP